MPQPVWHESQIWLAAGWTMFQFLGIGALVWILGAWLRWLLRRTPPEIRYVAALTLLLATAAIPVWLFVEAPDLVGRRARGDESPVRALIPSESVKPQPAFTGHKTIAISQPRDGARPAVGSTPPQTPMEWRAVFSDGWKALQDISCRWLPWLWLAGTPLALVVLACGVNGTSRLRRGAQPIADGEIIAAGQRLRQALGIGRHVAIIACDRVAAPILAGIVWPAILIPPAILAGCSSAQVEMILLHELAHVRRWDNLANFIQRIIEAALFFHPVVWWLSNWARLEREECCDRLVVAHTGKPQEYAEFLAALALPGIAPRHAAAAMTDSQLVTRIRHILKLEDERMNVSRKTFVAAAVILVVVGSFAASSAQQPKDKVPAAADTTPADRNADLASVKLPSDQQTTEAELLNRIKAAYVHDLGELLALQDATEPLETRTREARTLENSDLSATLALQLLALDKQTGDVLTTVNPASATRMGLATLLGQVAATRQKWGPEQATGAPDSPDWPNNQGTAWCPATADGREEWLELTYGEPVEPLVLVVYECLKPGALTRVLAIDTEGNEINAWSGKDPSPPDSGNGSAISVIPLKVKKLKIVRLRLYLDSPHVEGWNEIDAAGILDVKGAIHWATGATPSSTWVDQSTSTAAALGLVVSEPQYSTQRIEWLQGLTVHPRDENPGRIVPLESGTVLLQDATTGVWLSPIARLPISTDSENKDDRELKSTLLALNQQLWEAAAKGEAAVYEKLLADDYFGFYVNSAGFGRNDKAANIAAVKRRRYYDGSVRNAEVRRITGDAAVLTYIYDCKVDEGGRTWTYRNHQATQIWKLKDDRWLVSFAQDFVLPGGE